MCRIAVTLQQKRWKGQLQGFILSSFKMKYKIVANTEPAIKNNVESVKTFLFCFLQSRICYGADFPSAYFQMQSL